jgi:hypothetical protein
MPVINTLMESDRIMAINKIATLVSNDGTTVGTTPTWFSTASRLDAITAAVNGAATATSGMVTNVGSLYPLWPVQQYYSALTGVPDPSYVWNNAALPPTTPLFFAQAFQYTTLDITLLTRLATAEVFSDNAHTLFIEEYLNIPVVGLSLTTSVTAIGGESDGDLSDAGQAVSPPYGWQTISKFSSVYTPELPATIPPLSTYFFVVSFAAVNYSANGSANPAAIQYIVELYDDFEAG